MLERAIKSLERRIAEHAAKIARPLDFLGPEIPAIQVEQLATIKWPGEITLFQTQIAILRGIIEDKHRAGTS